MSNFARSQILGLSPYLRVKGGVSALEFYKQVFGAQETARLVDPQGRIGHAQLTIGGQTVMVSDEHPEFGIYGPEKYGGSGSLLHLAVTDVDELHARALAAGAVETMAPANMFYGERNSKFRDPFGHEWMLGQHIEDVPFDEMQRRYDAMMSSNG
jgi:PhnB protein